MADIIPAKLQEEFMNEVDSFIRRTMRSTKRRYERRKRRNNAQLILNEAINKDEELIDYIIGSKEIECQFGFLDSIENEKLYYALKSLSPKEQYLLKMKFLDDCTDDKIAIKLEYKIPSVRQSIFQTIKKMRKCMN